MADLDKKPAHETLSEIAEQKRNELHTINNYKPDGEQIEYNTATTPITQGAGGEYSEQNLDAISDGDVRGKGYLGSDSGKDKPNRVGNTDDIIERNKEVVKNVYNTDKEYPNF